MTARPKYSEANDAQRANDARNEVKCKLQRPTGANNVSRQANQLHDQPKHLFTKVENSLPLQPHFFPYLSIHNFSHSKTVLLWVDFYKLLTVPLYGTTIT